MTILVRKRGLIVVRLIGRIHLCSNSSKVIRMGANQSEIARHRLKVRFRVLRDDFITILMKYRNVIIAT